MILTLQQRNLIQKRINDPHVQAKAMACLQLITEDEKSTNGDVLAVASILMGAAKEIMSEGEKKDEIQISKD
ncbi:hypothetical protein [Bacillus phage vB_BceS-M2]|nr:hypothetical protein PBC5_066 [Bacillus phage PBC5]